LEGLKGGKELSKISPILIIGGRKSPVKRKTLLSIFLIFLEKKPPNETVVRENPLRKKKVNKTSRNTPGGRKKLSVFNSNHNSVPPEDFFVRTRRTEIFVKNCT